MFTQSYIRSILNYDDITGLFTWLVDRSRRAKAGALAGCVKAGGYVSIKIDGVDFLSHRLAWIYVNGDNSIPNSKEIDHINHDRADNRIVNLRVVTRSENQKNRAINKNNISGYCGVTWNKKAKKWQAQACSKGKNRYLGLFKKKSDAVYARQEANNEDSFHENHGANK
jgi:hypothetical protein